MLISPVTTVGQVLDDIDFSFSIETRAHVRDSEGNDFPINFPTNAALKTVDPGTNLEISTVTLRSDIDYKDLLRLRLRVQLIDLYDRNSTSDDSKIDVDEYSLRIGTEVPAGETPVNDARNIYLKLGKFGKFERQRDRHLESYGLVSTAFNRFEDLGLEIGFDISPHVYVKGSLTSGNPLFIRDPNALAGDNGTSDFLRKRDPKLNNGVVILYDAEVENLQFDHEFAEIGLGLGVRFVNPEATRYLDFLLFAYERDLKREAKLFGTLYGGDLDVLDAPGPNTFQDGEVVLNGLTGDYKREYGASLWIYLDDFAVFGQFVQQDVGGLDREGWEVEVSRKYFMPETLSIRGVPILISITPVIRYSIIDPDFTGPGDFPAPSTFWEWEKVDIGVKFGIMRGLDVTVEYAFNEFVRSGRDEENNEWLTTLRWRYGF